MKNVNSVRNKTLRTSDSRLRQPISGGVKSQLPELNKFIRQTEEYPYIKKPSRISSQEKKTFIKAGIDVTEKQRSGTFIQMDHSVVHAGSLYKGLEVMSITDALRKYNWLKNYWWKAVSVDSDEYTTLADREPHHGYFIRALPGVKVSYPLQACLFLRRENLIQNVHNIIIAEEDSQLNIITGCTVASYVKKGAHISISEFYVKRGARLTFTMIHNWAEEIIVRSRSKAILEENSTFLSNYICLKPALSLQMYPTATLIGRGGIARFNSILYAHPKTNLDVGARVILSAPNTRSEIISRAISSGGTIIARGHLKGEAPQVKAHLECRGLILSPEGIIHAIPELEGKTKDLDLSHEAAVGKIAKEEIEYLMARGLTAKEAQATIVRGFLDTAILGLPPELKEEIDNLIQSSEKEML